MTSSSCRDTFGWKLKRSDLAVHRTSGAHDVPMTLRVIWISIPGAMKPEGKPNALHERATLANHGKRGTMEVAPLIGLVSTASMQDILHLQQELKRCSSIDTSIPASMSGHLFLDPTACGAEENCCTCIHTDCVTNDKTTISHNHQRIASNPHVTHL